MKTIKDYVAFTKKWEGGWVNDPSDSGGETNIGITYKTWCSVFGTKAHDRFMKMADEDWWKVFKTLYWDKVQADKFNCFSIGVIVTGIAWGSGASRAGITLQQALNNLGKPLAIDGKIGMKTISAVNSCDDRELFDEIMRLRIAFFIAISKEGSKNAKFRKGWTNRANDYIKNFRP